MTAPLVKGWCPGAWRPMPSGDGLLVRIRPRGGRLSREQAAGITRLADWHGNGMIELSTRGNIQLRGVTPATHAPLVTGLAALGLIDPTPEAEGLRNIVTTPFWQGGDGTVELTARLENALLDGPTPDLPAKFGFAVDTGTRPVLRDVSADIRLERDPSGALLCRADGTSSGARVTPETAIPVALELARWFAASGGHGRMQACLQAGAALPAIFTGVDAAPRCTQPGPVPGPSAAGFMIGLPFGQMRARTLFALANIAPLRVTPWRMLLLEGQAGAPDLDDIITHAEDPLLRVVACPGLPDCAQAHQPTRPLARALAPHVPKGRVLHVSGCAKGCAQPQRAWLSLVAQAHGFGLVRNGNAKAAPIAPLLPVERILASPTMLMENPDALSV
ncbi:precorrin-3B synthase [Acetobacter sp. TBRC 12305]|uniref:Precorrin-3B synthase n=1 Tax=Acetobacter garciniae TaxID=2817435 RepID=A0A939KMV7_9PROT|nr:precorrin-3B synthase [Acetobacter garciniae]MBO1325718.1 precorrin-3B synthase [Acetobacter garciniae]MBX0345618.1 precorrin-3B synthase [Acetobacter garciniae]